MEINYIILKQGVDDNMTHKITIIGLGNYGLDDLPLEYIDLFNNKTVYMHER